MKIPNPVGSDVSIMVKSWFHFSLPFDLQLSVHSTQDTWVVHWSVHPTVSRLDHSGGSRTRKGVRELVVAEAVIAEKAAISLAASQDNLSDRRGGGGSMSRGLLSHSCCSWRDHLLSLKRDCSEWGRDGGKGKVSRQTELKKAISCCLTWEAR